MRSTDSPRRHAKKDPSVTSASSFLRDKLSGGALSSFSALIKRSPSATPLIGLDDYSRDDASSLLDEDMDMEDNYELVLTLPSLSLTHPHEISPCTDTVEEGI
jgi:hypothetical protein